VGQSALLDNGAGIGCRLHLTRIHAKALPL
jgi:hypothetical protein